jgi:hypothetical protein
MVGGIISNSYGAKLPFMVAGYGNIIVHLLCPLAAQVHTELFFACRLVQGIFAVKSVIMVNVSKFIIMLFLMVHYIPTIENASANIKNILVVKG